MQQLQRGVRVIGLTIHPGSTTVAYPSSVDVSASADAVAANATDPNMMYASMSIEAYTVDAPKTDTETGTGAAAKSAGGGD